MTPNIEYIALVLGDYCDLQIDGIVPATNRYPVADVMEQVGLLEHLQPVANEVLARRIAELERQLSEQTALVFDLTAQRDTAWQELRGIRVAISANPEESTADEVRRVVHQLGTTQSMHVDNVRQICESRNCGRCSELAEKHDALAAQAEVLKSHIGKFRKCETEHDADAWEFKGIELSCAAPVTCLAQMRADAVEAAIKFCNHHMAFPVNHGKIADRVIAVSELIMYAERIRQGGAA